MEDISVVTKIRETGENVAAFARAEGKGWRRFVAQRASKIESDARALLSVPAIERKLLTTIDDALKAIDAKVRARLASLDKPSRANGAKKPRRAKPVAKPKTATPSALAGAVKH